MPPVKFNAVKLLEKTSNVVAKYAHLFEPSNLAGKSKSWKICARF